MSEDSILSGALDEQMKALEFSCEIKKVEAKKLASLDMSFRLTLETSDPAILALGTIEGDRTVNVTIEPETK